MLTSRSGQKQASSTMKNHLFAILLTALIVAASVRVPQPITCSKALSRAHNNYHRHFHHHLQQVSSSTSRALHKNKQHEGNSPQRDNTKHHYLARVPRAMTWSDNEAGVALEEEESLSPLPPSSFSAPSLLSQLSQYKAPNQTPILSNLSLHLQNKHHHQGKWHNSGPLADRNPF